MTISLSVSERQKRAAEKAWITIRKKRIAQVKAKNESIEEYLFHKDMRTVLQGVTKGSKSRKLFTSAFRVRRM